VPFSPSKLKTKLCQPLGKFWTLELKLSNWLLFPFTSAILNFQLKFLLAIPYFLRYWYPVKSPLALNDLWTVTSFKLVVNNAFKFNLETSNPWFVNKYACLSESSINIAKSWVFSFVGVHSIPVFGALIKFKNLNWLVKVKHSSSIKLFVPILFVNSNLSVSILNFVSLSFSWTSHKLLFVSQVICCMGPKFAYIFWFLYKLPPITSHKLLLLSIHEQFP